MGIYSVESQCFCVSGQLSVPNKQALLFKPVSDCGTTLLFCWWQTGGDFPPLHLLLIHSCLLPLPIGAQSFSSCKPNHRYDCPWTQMSHRTAFGEGGRCATRRTLASRSKSKLFSPFCCQWQTDPAPLPPALHSLLLQHSTH